MLLGISSVGITLQSLKQTSPALSLWERLFTGGMIISELERFFRFLDLLLLRLAAGH